MKVNIFEILQAVMALIKVVESWDEFKDDKARSAAISQVALLLIQIIGKIIEQNKQNG